jgi:hypothetical protein
MWSDLVNETTYPTNGLIILENYILNLSRYYFLA